MTAKEISIEIDRLADEAHALNLRINVLARQFMAATKKESNENQRGDVG